MKSILAIITVLLVMYLPQLNLKAQTPMGQVNKTTKGFWIEKMQDPNLNFYQLQDDFYNYWEGRNDYKSNGYKIFKRWEYINQSRVLKNGKLQSPSYVMDEFNRYLKTNGNNKSASGDWTLVGPSEYPANTTAQPTGMGRVNAIAFHPSDVNIIYVGAPAGGFWKSLDGGASWVNLSSNLTTLGVSSIIVDYSNPNIIYIGSGDRDGGDAPGLGVFKSTDGGGTWTQINSTMGDVTVGAMVMHPSNNQIIIAATSGGIFKTTDGGNSWTLIITGNFKDLKLNPGDPDIVYAAYASSYYGARLYRSSDNGDSWTHITSGIPNAGTSAAGARMVIGVSADEPSYVYLVQIEETTKVFQSLLRSTDNGLSFSTMSTSPNILGYNCDGSGTASQATYDLCLTVDPSDGNTIYVGGLNNWKSSDGGVNWTIVSHWIGSTYGNPCAASVHADQHCYAWNNGKLYVGHDGGVNYTSDGGTTWTEISAGLEINQIYKIGQSATVADMIIFGQQDNGTAVNENDEITTVIGGDGSESIIDYSDANYKYGSYITGDIRRSTGGAYYNIAQSANGLTEDGPWITPYIMHFTDPNTLFAGYQNVWRTNNVKTTTYTDVSWSAISSGETSNCIAIEQSPANVDILYIVRSGSVKRSDNANASAASVSWTACALPGGNTPTALEAHPTDQNIVYATAGYGVYKSEDKGASWTDISGSLPSLFTNSLVYDINSNEGIYVANQTAVFYKDADMADWVLFSTGLPIVDVRELEIYYDAEGTQHKIKVGTYGRGLWESDLYESGVLNPADFTATATSNTQITLNWNLNAAGNHVILAYNTTATFGDPVDGNSYSVSSTLAGGGTVIYNGGDTEFIQNSLSENTKYYYKIWSYNGSLEYSSGITANETTTESIADFSIDNNISCNGSLQVNFADQSVGAYNSWAWDVDNNGTTDYTSQNPTHQYSSSGLYSVKLSINGEDDQELKENLILVMDSEPTDCTACTLTDNGNYENGFGIGIFQFSLNNIDKSSSNNDGYYQDYSCENWTELQLNTSYDVSITTGTFNPEGARVYIDYNDNGEFESSESIVSFPANTDGSRTLSFTTPASGVTLNKGLRLRVLSKFGSIPSDACNISTYGQAEDYTVYFDGNTDVLWTGAVSSDWNNASNWNTSAVPNSENDVVITSSGNSPIISAGDDANCNDLTINSGATLTIENGGSLINAGTISNNGTFNMELSMTNNHWHMVSSPVQGAKANVFYGDYLQYFDETLSSDNYIEVSDENVSLIPCKGYSVSHFSKGDYVFSGTPYSGNQSIATTQQQEYGWNLIGNPYPSSLDWNLLDDTYGSVYTYIDNGVNEGWRSYNDGVVINGVANEARYIAPMQGFFISTSGSGTFAVSNIHRTHSGSDGYVKSDAMLNQYLKLQIISEDKMDETVIQFGEEYSNDFDQLSDAWKMGSETSENLLIYTITDDGNLAIDRRPETEVVQLGVKYPHLTTASISIKESNGFELVSIEDTKLNNTHDLKTSAYNFDWNMNDSEERFKLHLGATGINDADFEEAHIYSSSNKVFIKLKNPEEYQTIEIFDLAGRNIFVSPLEKTELQYFSLSETGIYIVKLTGISKVKEEKIIIK